MKAPSEERAKWLFPEELDEVKELREYKKAFREAKGRILNSC